MLKFFLSVLDWSASILGVDVFAWKKWWQSLRQTPIRRLHCDIIDGHFAPQISFGSAFLTNFTDPQWQLEGHFMVDFTSFSKKDLLHFWDQFSPHLTTFICHWESLTASQLKLFLDYCQAKKLKKGLAIKLETDWQLLLPYLPMLDHLLLLAVPVGFSGQKFQPSVLEKLKRIAAYRQKLQYDFLLEVDGGINQTTLPLLKNSGCDSVVLGSFLRPSPQVQFKLLTD